MALATTVVPAPKVVTPDTESVSRAAPSKSSSSTPPVAICRLPVTAADPIAPVPPGRRLPASDTVGAISVIAGAETEAPGAIEMSAPMPVTVMLLVLVRPFLTVNTTADLPVRSMVPTAVRPAVPRACSTDRLPTLLPLKIPRSLPGSLRVTGPPTSKLRLGGVGVGAENTAVIAPACLTPPPPAASCTTPAGAAVPEAPTVSLPLVPGAS